MQRTGWNICLHLSGGDCSDRRRRRAALDGMPEKGEKQKERKEKGRDGDSGEKIGVLREEGKCKETKIHLSITSPSIS